MNWKINMNYSEELDKDLEVKSRYSLKGNYGALRNPEWWQKDHLAFTELLEVDTLDPLTISTGSATHIKS